MQLENSKIEEHVSQNLQGIISSFNIWMKDLSHIDEQKVFLSREGWTLGKGYNQLFPNEKCSYARSSRILLNSIHIQNHNDIINIIKKPSLDTTIKNFLKVRFGLEASVFFEAHKKIISLKMKRREIEDYILNSDQKELLFDDILRTTKHRKSNLVKYYEQIFKNNDNINLIDIGYNGSFKKALQHLFPDKKFKGFYLGTFDESQDNDYGFLFNKVNNNNDNYEIENNVLFLEYLLSTRDGTVIDIDENCIPILDTHNMPQKVKRIQDNVFARLDINKKNFNSEFIINPDKDLIKFFKHESIEDKYRNNKKHFLISNRILKITEKQKKDFIKDSAWKSGAKNLLY